MVSLHRDLDSVKTRTWKPARRIGTRQLRREKDVLMFNPNLVIMPGLDGLAGLCEDFVRAICGFGGSAREISFPENRCLQFDQLAELVSRDLEANERRPYIIVAQSFSGHVALRLAASKCSRRGVATNLKGVVFVNSFIKSPLPQLLSRTLADSPLTGPRAASSLPPKNVSQRLLVNGDPSSSGIVDKLYSNVRRHPPEVISHRLRMCLETDSSSIFTNANSPRLPMLYLEGKADPLSVLRVSAAMKNRVSNLKIRAVHGGPHLLLQQRPDECARLLAQFWNDLRQESYL